jgi:hypothetical protein
MVLTNKFVFIHMPKTGGTFVTSALRRLHAPKSPSPAGQSPVRRLIRRVSKTFEPGATLAGSPYGHLIDLEPKHGTCHEIPEGHRDKPILSCIRSPYDWYVSQYEFAWWKRTSNYEPGSPSTPVGYAIEQVLPAFQETHPHFPGLSFEEFVRLCRQAAQVYNASARVPLGLYSHGYVRYFYRDVSVVMAEADRDYFRLGRRDARPYDVHFLRTDRLNADLHAFLSSLGYRQEDLDFLPTLGRILPMGIGRRDDQPWEAYYTPALKQEVREQEWALFDLFPELDV